MFDRRRFLFSAAAASFAASLARGQDLPEITNPRATAGDDLEEPNWDERLTITVGNDRGDLAGRTHQVIQAAVDMAGNQGGGTVQLLPGTWKLRNSIFLCTGVRLVGSGDDTILIKEPSHSVKLAADSDWFDQEITLAEPGDFRLGDGVCLRTKNPHHGGEVVLKRTLVARSGKRFKLDRALRENFWLAGESTCAALFPLLTAEEMSDFVIENLTLDGNRAQNENLNGNYGGGIFLQDCNRALIRGVTTRNYNGDGISWQICHDVLVEDCHSHGHAGLGLHPGSGSQRPIIRDNRLEENDIGIFFCWGVKYGLAEGNDLIGNRCGISIGHHDTENMVRANLIRDSREVGVLYRPERGKDFAPHRNRLEENTIENTGGDEAVAIDVQGATEGNIIARNIVREKRSPAKRVGVRVSRETEDLTLADNEIEGFARAVEDLRG